METRIITNLNPSPNSPQYPPLPSSPPPPPRSFAVKRPSLRVTSEFDSENQLFFHKISSNLFDGLAKLKLSFQNDNNGDISCPQLGFLTKHFSVLYDVESKNALLSGSVNLSKSFQVKATHDVKEQHGVVAMVASLADPSYKLELSSTVPSLGLDQEMSFIPSISYPSNALSIAFKRRFSPSDKLSYCYHFDSNEWSTVFKHTVGMDLKFKAGYDSEVRLGWASLWVGDEDGKAKTSPMKMKVQFMLQVPQDDARSSAIMFRVKKSKLPAFKHQ